MWEAFRLLKLGVTLTEQGLAVDGSVPEPMQEWLLLIDDVYRGVTP